MKALHHYLLTIAVAALFLQYGSVEASASDDDAISYRFAYSSDTLLLSGTAHLGEVLIGELRRVHVEFEYNNGMEIAKWIDFDEIHYDPNGSGKIIYKAKSRFSRNVKIKEERLSGAKAINLFPSIGSF